MEEVTLHSDHSYRNPFSDVTVTATFNCSGKQVNATGFFDGDGIWRVRFMPESVGDCSFITHSTDASLNNTSGNFKVVPASAGNHGMVQVAKKFHFSYSDGTPYFLLGTTLYNWVNRDADLREETVEALSTSGFTKARFGLFPKWYQFNRLDPERYPFVEISHHKFDLDRFDPKFFQKVEGELLKLQDLGIEADIILFHPYDTWGFASMDQSHDEAYIKYVAARFSAFRNVWWTMANEYDLFTPSHNPSIPEKDWDALFRTLQASDPYGHLRGIHNIAKWYDHSKPWITHTVIQDGLGHPERNLLYARAKYGKPTVVDELGYEGNNGAGWGSLTGEEEVLRMWHVTMRGGYSSHGETYVHPGGILWWAAGGELVGESPVRLSFMRKIMTEGPFQDVVPAPDLAEGGYMLALPGIYYLFQDVSEGGFGRPPADEVQLADGHVYSVELVDPWRMRIYSLGYTQGGLQAFRAPFSNAVLRFREQDQTSVTNHSDSIQNLVAKFLNDTTPQTPIELKPIVVKPYTYNAESTLSELMDNPTTAALLQKYIPNIPNPGRSGFMSIEVLQRSDRLTGPGADIPGLIRELEKIPRQ